MKRKAEKVAPEQAKKGQESTEQKAAGQFNLREALNARGFAEFLARYEDREDLDFSDAEVIKERFEAFKTQSEVARGLKQVYREGVMRDTGIRLEDKELAAVEDFVAREAIADPEAVGRLAGEIRDYAALPQDIAKKEQELAKLGRREALQEKARTLKTVAETQGVLNKKNLPLIGRLLRSSQEQEARRRLEEEYKVDFKNVDAELGRTLDTLDTLEEADNAKKELKRGYELLRSTLFQDLEPAQAIAALAREKAQRKLEELMDEKKGLKDLEKAQEYFAQLQRVEAQGIDYLEGYDIEATQEELDQLVDARLLGDLKEVVEKTSLASTPYDGLRRMLEGFLKKETLGSSKGAEAKERVLDALRLVGQQQAVPVERRLLLRALLVELSA